MFWVKVYRTREATVLAACDEELLGNVFREGKVVLRVSESYYKGERVGREELSTLIREADIIGLVGKRAVGCAVSMGYMRWDDVKYVSGIPHMNIYKL